MSTYKTGNPLGSAAAKDFYDNAQNLDDAVNDPSSFTWTDRFGRKRKTWRGIEKSAADAIAAFGYITIDSFEDGAELTLANQVLRWESNGEYYRWDGDFPKTVPTGSTPQSSGGVGSGAWLSVGDATLRTDVKNALQNDLYSNHQRKIAYQLPLLFPDYDAVLAANVGATYIYPQAFCVSNEKLYISYNVEPKQTNNVIVVYDNVGAYLGFYYVANGGAGVATEGLVVTSDYGGEHLFVGSASGVIKEFSLDGASFGGSLTLVANRSVGVYNQFGYRNGKWIVEQNTPEVGQLITRTVLSVYDVNFSRKGTLTFPLHDSGYITATTSDYSAYYNKRQGMAVGDNFIAFGFGGYFADAAATQSANLYQGSKIFNPDGSKRTESMLKPQGMIDLMKSYGLSVTRIENEGVAVSDDGEKLYSLFVHMERTSSLAYSTGVVIFEEYSNDRDAIDFKYASAIYQGYNVDHASVGVFPRSFDGLVNPVTGAVFTSLTDILKYMQSANQKAFSFYTGTVSLTDISGAALPASTLVKVDSANNQTFAVSYLSSEGAIRYMIGTSSDGSFVFIRSREAIWANNITIAQTTEGASQLNRIFGASYSGFSTNADKILAIDQQSNSTANGLIIGGSSSAFKSATTVDFATNPTNTALGGTVRFRIADYGMRPFADNAYTFGQAAFRLSTIYAATGTINTSDERMKTDIVELSAAEKAVAVNLKSLIRRFKFTESVQAKGEDARYHVGIIAQQVKAAFEAQGLVAEEYGILCHDVWGDEYGPVMATRDVQNEAGEITQEDYDTGESVLITAAGDRYSVRYEELLCFIIGAM